MHNKTLTELSNALQAKEFSSLELTKHYLDRAHRLDQRYNCFITLTPELALQQAKDADQHRSNSSKNSAVNPLLGIPIAHKDIFCTSGVKTSCGSKMLDNFIPPYDATVIQNFNQAGAVCLGKTNMDEFAMGSSNETSFYGAVKNPWNIQCVPGGSSGGSAAAVAALLAAASTGTDTGGSIRQPAALCGISGIKPTYGRVSRYGMIAFASSLDQAGPMARSAEDLAIMLNTMAGFDPKDSTSSETLVPDFRSTLNNDLAGLTIGLPKEYFGGGLSAAVEQTVQAAIKEFEQMGAIIKEVSLPHTDLAIPCYYIVAPSEASANLSRFDGVRYGYRCKEPENLFDLYSRTREEGFGDEVKRRILIGTYALSAGFYDAYYRKAQQIRRLVKNDFTNAFEQVDVILGPTAPNPAFAIGEKSNDPVTMYLEDLYTIPASLSGLPCMSVPSGFVDDKPVGLQLIGNYFNEAKLLNIAHRYQQRTKWHQQTAPSLEE